MNKNQLPVGHVSNSRAMKNLTEGSTKTNIKKIDPAITKDMVLPPPAPKPSKQPCKPITGGNRFLNANH